jgi:hypothetical protein
MYLFRPVAHIAVFESQTSETTHCSLWKVEKTRVDKYKEIINDCNYDANCTLTSLAVSNFKRLILISQSAEGKIMYLFFTITLMIIICVCSKIFYFA